MLFYDTETTGLPHRNKPLSEQPAMVEIAVIKLDDDTLDELGCLNTMLNPGKPIDPGASKASGIFDDDVKDAQTFENFYPELREFVEGETVIWAHNNSFDKKILGFELARINKVMDFPHMTYKCTYEKSTHVYPHMTNHKLETLHKELCDPLTEQTHRALDDVRLCIDIYKEMMKK